MALDSSIYGQYAQPAQSIEQVQSALATNDLNRLKAQMATDELRQQRQQQNALSAAMATGTTGSDLEDQLARSGQGKLALDLRATRLKQEGEIVKTQQDKFKLASDQFGQFSQQVGALSQKPDLSFDDVMGTLKTGVQTGLFNPQHAMAVAQHLQGQNPDQLRASLADIQQGALTVKDQIDAKLPKPTQVNLGDRVAFIDTNPKSPTFKQEVSSSQINMSPAQAAQNRIAEGNLAARNAENAGPSGGAAPTTSPEQLENVAQMIASGRMAPLGQMALRTPQGFAIMSRVHEINPDYSAQDYGSQSKAVRDFATGKQGSAVRSFNVSLDHLDTLSDLAKGLGNGNVQLINKAANIVASQTGNPAPTNFDAAKKIVSDEIVKAIVGGGGGVADREEAAKTIQNASSPQQLAGVIDTYKALMRGQLMGLRRQYEQSTGRTDFDRFLSKSGQQQAHGAPAAKPAGKPATPTVSNW